VSIGARLIARRSSFVLLVGLAVALACPPLAQGADAVSGQLIVGVKRQTAPAVLEALVERAGGRLTRRLGRVDAGVVRPASGEKLSALRRRLEDHPGVRYVEPDYVLERSRTPDDPFYVRQYALQPSAGGISAPVAWDQRTHCSLVAVLDSGVQYDHPDLKGNVWHNSGEKKSNGKDDDDNGYVDDYYGADVRDAKGSGGDTNGHGSHVAGIIAADGDNATGVTGACWSGSIMPVAFMDSRGRGSTSDAVAGIDYAVHEKAKVINCSFGSSGKSKALEDAVKHAKEKGVLLVVAAGNEGVDLESEPLYPASSTSGNVLTVAATTSTDALASFSNFGRKSVDVGAPGDGIYSTYPESRYKELSGTSMAAPLVAAAAAMLRARDSKLSYSDIRSLLKASVDPTPALSGRVVTGGRLNIARALERAGA
jgi:subtilisin family serine protease